MVGNWRRRREGGRGSWRRGLGGELVGGGTEEGVGFRDI